MNKSRIRKLIPALLLALLVISAGSSAAADTGSQMNVLLRIEGISGNLFYDELTVPYDTELTAANVLSYADDISGQLTVTGEDTGFITDINGEVSGTFGGWDGWLFMVNGESPSVGVDGFVMSECDVLVVYYGDPFGAGMQFPEADLTDLEDGILIFKSSDTTYDNESNPIVTVNPVAGATVTWFSGADTDTFTTDSNGSIVIPESLLTAGTHRIQIAKSGAVSSGSLYLPLVLRFAPDHEITIEAREPESSSEVSSASTDSSPASGDDTGIFTYAVILFVLLAAMLVFRGLKRKMSR